MATKFELDYTGEEINEAIRLVREGEIKASITEEDKQEIVDAVLSNFIDATKVAL